MIEFHSEPAAVIFDFDGALFNSPLRNFGNFFAGPAMCRLLKLCSGLFKSPTRPNVVSIFAALHTNRIKTAVYSKYTGLERRMAALGIAPVLCGLSRKDIFGPESFKGLKPPHPFMEIAAVLKVPAGQILVVGGNDESCACAAREAGMRFVRIASSADWKDFCTLVA